MDDPGPSLPASENLSAGKSSLWVAIPTLVTARVVVNTLYRMVYPFLPVFSRSLGVDLGSLSLVITARSLMGVLSPFLGSIADRRGRKAGLLFGLGLFSAGVSLVYFRPLFPFFILSLLLGALGKDTFDPALQAYIGDRIPYRRRGLAMALIEMSWSFSFIFGIPVAGFLIARSGWVSPFPFLALAGLFFMFLIAWMIPGDPVAASAAASFFPNIRLVYACWPALAGLAMGVLISMGNEVVNLVFGVWIEDSFGVQIAALGLASTIIGLSEFGGESLVGVFADRLGKPFSIGMGLVLNCAAVLALPLFGGNFKSALVGLFLFYITFEFTIVSTYPLMSEILPNARGTIMGMYVTSQALGRAAGDLAAAPLYRGGIFTSAIAAVLLNILALAFLLWLKKGIGDGRVLPRSA